MMKKMMAMALCAVMMLSMLASCNKIDLANEDPGVTIPVYLSAEAANFDPAYANLDDNALKIMSLLYEGLYKIDEDGDVVKAQAKSVKKLDDPDEDFYAIEITLKNTSWSDGTRVQASDYIYAWKRILESDFRGEAASMLFGIKNARAVNSGDASIDDLGLTDVSAYVMRIEFEGPTDYDKFYEYLASPMLVPLREVAVDRVPADWSSNPSIMVSNGPFMVRSFVYGDKMILERNIYYKRNVEEDSLKKYVTPFRLSIQFVETIDEAVAAFEAGKLAYLGDIPLAKRAEYLSSGIAEVNDTMTMMSVLFNTNVEPFNDPNVRKALSLAVDRNKIVEILTFAKVAEGFIADGVLDNGDSFRENGEALLSASANKTEAEKLLKDAGVKGGTINLTVRSSEADLAVAAYLKEVWDALGFNVKINEKKLKKYTDTDTQFNLVEDRYLSAYEEADFDVILVDYTMLSTDAFPTLAMFAKSFAGGKMDMNVTDGNYQLATHISGYDSAEYEAKIEAIFAEKDEDVRSELLHEAEEMLLADMPIMPLVQLQSGAAVSEDLSKLSVNYWGFDIFTKAKLGHVENYTTTKD